MEDFLDKLQQLYKENPSLAKVVEAYSVMDFLQHNAQEASNTQNQRNVVSQNTSHIKITLSNEANSTNWIK